MLVHARGFILFYFVNNLNLFWMERGWEWGAWDGLFKLCLDAFGRKKEDYCRSAKTFAMGTENLRHRVHILVYKSCLIYSPSLFEIDESENFITTSDFKRSRRKTLSRPAQFKLIRFYAFNFQMNNWQINGIRNVRN